MTACSRVMRCGSRGVLGIPFEVMGLTELSRQFSVEDSDSSLQNYSLRTLLRTIVSDTFVNQISLVDLC